MIRPHPLGPATLLGVLLAASTVRGADLSDGYADPGRVAESLRGLAGRIRGGTIVEYGKSREGRPLLALQVTRAPGNVTARPALLVVGGVDPERLASAEMALAIAERAGAPPDTGIDPLVDVVLYVIADAAPDGRARVLAGQAGWIGGPVDDDSDGRLDEDGPDDLDGDGLVRWMRVWRAGGTWLADTSDVRAAMKADAAAGRPGQFDLVREGRDNDGDDRLGEDPPGAVRLDANFPHAWELFGRGAGLYPMSEPESKSLADFILARPNIAAALVLSQEDNLGGSGGGSAAAAGGGKGRGGRAAGGSGGSSGAIGARLGTGAGGSGASGGGGGGGAAADPGAAKASGSLGDRGAPAGAPMGQAGLDLLPRESTTRPPGGFGGGARSPITTVPEADQPYYERAAKAWQEAVALPKNGDAAGGAGSLSGWLRYQLGAFTLSATGWALPDSGQTSSEAGTFKYLAQTDASSAFREWRPFEHPDLPGRRVEIGGLDPLLGVVPPHGAIDSLGAKQAGFARTLLGWMPRLVIDAPEVRALGDGLYRVSLEIVNSGWLPTALEAGVTTRRARPVRVEIVRQDGVEVVGGPPVKLIPALAGSGGRERIEWIVKAPAGTRLVVRAATPRAGEATSEVTLR